MNVLRHKLVKTRKPHNCWGCCKKMPKGSDMWANTSAEDVIYTVHWCLVCNSILEEHGSEMDPYNDGYAYGDLEGMANEYLGANA